MFQNVSHMRVNSQLRIHDNNLYKVIVKFLAEAIVLCFSFTYYRFSSQGEREAPDNLPLPSILSIQKIQKN